MAVGSCESKLIQYDTLYLTPLFMLQYWCAIFNAICFVFLFLFMEETNYPGRVPRVHGNSPQVTASDLEEDEEKSHRIHDSPIPPSHPSATTTKSFPAKLSLVHRRSLAQPNRLFQMAYRPLYLLTFPIVTWCGFTYGSGLVWFNLLNGSASLILTGPPYHFRPALVGLAYVAPILGVVLAHIYCGPLGDRIAIWLARRHGGYLEAEFRLWLFLPSLLLVPAGLILYGVGAAHAVHWFGPIFAMGIIAAVALVALQLPVAYVVDSYYAVSSEAVVSVILVRNSMSFAIGYGITPWLDNMGLQNAFLVAAFIGMLQTSTFFVFTNWGKAMRQSSLRRYERLAGAVREDEVLE